MSRRGLVIWYLTAEYPPFFGGGIGTYSRLTVAGWLGEGHRVTVFLYDPGVAGSALVVDTPEGGLTVLRFGVGYGGPGAGALASEAQTAWRYAEAVADWTHHESPPDIVETQDFDGLAYFLLMRQRALDPALPSCPVVVTVHNPNFVLDAYEHRARHLLPRYWTGHMERAVLAAADHAIFPSAHLRTAVAPAVPSVPSTVLRNPLPLPAAGPPATRRDTVLAVGRLQLFKGTLELVEGMAQLWDAGSRVVLELVGADHRYHARDEGVQAYLTRRYARHVAEGRIIFRGAEAPQEVSARVASAGVVVVASRFDNLPYTALEAMAHGRVLVASDAGGQRELVRHGVNGWLVAPTPAAIAEGVAAVLELSDAEWERLGENARATIETACDPARIAAEKSQLFRMVVDRHRGAPPRRVYPFVHPVAPRARPDDGPGGPRLSLVIPYFNMGAYVEECLASVYASDVRPDEVVLVDDGSTDPGSIARLYALEQDAHYPGLQVVRGPNRGLAGARNRGADATRGRYLAFLDPDDAVEPGYWSWALRVLEAYDNVSFVGAWAMFFGDRQDIWPAWNPELPYILYHNTLHSSCLVMRRDDFFAHGVNDPRFVYGLEDWEAVVRMVGAGLGGVAIPAPLARYRVRADSMARAFRPESLMFLYEELLAKHSALLGRWAVPVASLLNANGPQYLATNPTRGTEYEPPAWLRGES